MSKKYWDKKVSTTDKKDSWQEPFERETSVSAKAIQAIDTLLGFSGSWMGAYANPYTSREEGIRHADAPSSNPNWRISNLGRLGYPELNFIPYNYRTNVFGSKGGALIGHPISFSIVGPTAKRSEISWVVQDATHIELDTTDTLMDIYGDLKELIEGGLYFVVSETGRERGNIIYDLDSIFPLEEYGQSAKFEIFRVIEIEGSNILVFDKPITDYFDLGSGKPRIEQITLFKPYATRLVAVPDSGDQGAEKKFLVISPEYAAYGDLNPKNNDPAYNNASLKGGALQKGQMLPIPLPLKNLSGTLGSTPMPIGIFEINLPVGHGVNQGEIIHITDVNGVGLQPDPLSFNLNECLGWFEVLDANIVSLIVRGSVEVDTNVGEIFANSLFVDQNLYPNGEIQLTFTVHEHVRKIFEGEYNPDKVDSVRLTNLIDPNWVDRTTKLVSDDAEGTLFGGSPAKADRAIFTTNRDVLGNSFSDAGNLLDLGFRMVLFPAKENVNGDVVPDFDNPITSNEVIIDPSLTEKQTIDIDYSAGTVTLSHAPVDGGQIMPHGIVGAKSGNNRRGEVVLFACCVPYSMEKGQTGTGVSISGGDLRHADHGVEAISYASPLGQIVPAEILNISNTGDYYVRCPEKLPRNAYFSVVAFDEDSPTENDWSSRYLRIDDEELTTGFYKVSQLDDVRSTSNGVEYRYILSGFKTTNFPPLPEIHQLIIRKQNITFTSLIEDNSYGSAYRSDTVRFAFADIEANVDGSITVFPTATKGPAQELRGLFPLGGEKDWGRVAFNTNTQRWTVSSPTHKNPEEYQIGLEIVRGKAYIQDYIQGFSDIERMIYAIDYLHVDRYTKDQIIVEVSETVEKEAELVKLFAEFPQLQPLFIGETFYSQERDWSTETFGNHRMVVAIYDEEAHTPHDWLAIVVPDNMPPQGIVNELMQQSMALKKGLVVSVEGQTRIGLTERSFEVMPSTPYLISREITAADPFVVADKTRMFITVRSATKRYPNRWVTLPIQTDNANLSDPVEVAAFLNRSLYDRTYDFYSGDSLVQGGFFRESAFPAMNPYLGGAAIGGIPALGVKDAEKEHCILFAAHDDIRHPAFNDPTNLDYNKVILLCGGRGAGTKKEGSLNTNNSIPDYDGMVTPLIENGTVMGYDMLFNVLVEVSEDIGENNDNLVDALGGTFKGAAPKGEAPDIVRFGLFYHPSARGISSDIETNMRPSPPYDQRAFAKVGEIFAPNGYGTITCGRFLGTFEIIEKQFDGSSGLTLILRDNKVSSYRDDTSSHLLDLPVNSPYNYSRGTKHQVHRFPLNLADSTACGWYTSWFQVVGRRVEVAELNMPLGMPPKIYPFSILHRFTGIPSRPFIDGQNLKGQGIRVEDPNGSSDFNGVLLKNGFALLRQAFSNDIFDPDAPNVEFKEFPFEVYPRKLGYGNDHRSLVSIKNPHDIVQSGDQSGLPNITYIAGASVELFSSDHRNSPSSLSFGTTEGTLLEPFLTHMEHGVWRFFNEGDTSDMYWGKTHENDPKFSDGIYTSKEPSISGVAGVRISGDTQIWMTDAKFLSSNGDFTAAFIKERDKEALTFTNIEDFDLDHPLSSRNRNRKDDFTANPAREIGIGGHAPFNVKASKNRDGLLLQEAVVLLGLNNKNHEAFENFILAGTNNLDDMNTVFGLPSDKLYLKDQFNYAQTLSETFLIKNLEGKFIELTLPSKGSFPIDTPPYTYGQNVGRWRIVEAPVLHSGTSQYAQLLASNQTKSFVSVVALKVERWVYPTAGFRKSVIAFEDTAGDAQRERHGYAWSIHPEVEGDDVVMTSTVYETGGIPTAVPSSLRGMTIDPLALGKDSLPMTIVKEPTGQQVKGKLYGVFPHMTSGGISKTVAFFSLPFNGVSRVGGEFKGIISSWEEQLFLDDSEDSFIVDSQGKASFRMTRRLGRGIFLDGGLGVVHATGFRSNPRPVKQVSIGGLQVFGSAGYPYTDTPNRNASVLVSNILDTTEFVDDVYVIAPKGKIVFEDARALSGLASRIKENSWASKSTFSEGTYDALLPYNMGGLMFRGSGGVVYSRPFSPLNSYASVTRQYLGKPIDSGLKGMGVPNFGGCLLLPKGAPTQKGEGTPNWNSGGFPTLKGATPLDVPLYEFVQGSNHTLTEFGSNENSLFGCSSFHTSSAGIVEGHAVTGLGTEHEANSGTLHNSSSPAYSRYSPTYNSANEQLVIREGMIVEDVTNGTFYTVGEIGRNWIQSSFVSDGMYYTSSTGEADRPQVQGSRIVATGNDTESILFDFNPLVGHMNSLPDPCHGFGDRTDTFQDADVTGTINGVYLGKTRTHVRTPTIGHKLRVTPNVEFVPVLGEHGVDGGLLPASEDLIERGADALFYSLTHEFKTAGLQNGSGDIGKFLYICGTDCYNYTGWWVIIDVLPQYVIQGDEPVSKTGAWGVTPYDLLTRNVAVLRKWKRNEGREGDSDTNNGALPLGNRSPTLRMTGSPHLKDLNGGSPMWFVNGNCSDMLIQFTDNELDSVSMTVPSAFFVGKTLATTVSTLNADPLYNGQNLFGVANVIKWQFEGIGDLHGSITVGIDKSVSTIIWERYSGHAATIFGQFSPNALVTNMNGNVPDTMPQRLGQSGFFSYPGVNSAVDRGAGDRNNSAIMHARPTPLFSSYSAARGLRWVFSHPLSEENVGSYLHLTRPRTRYFNQDVYPFLKPTDDGANPRWVSRYPTQYDLFEDRLRLKTDIFRINRCPSTKDMVVGGDCEVFTRGLSVQGTETDSFVYSPLGLDYGFWQDTLNHDYKNLSFYNSVSLKPYNVRPLRNPTQYALQPIAREKIITVNPSSGSSNTLMQNSPKIQMEKIEYFTDPNGGARIENHYVVTCLGSGNNGEFGYPKDTLSVGTPIIFRETKLNSLNGTVGYVLGFEDMIMWSANASAYDNKVRIKIFTPDFNVQLNPNAYGTTGWLAVTEGLRPLNVNGVDLSQPFKLRAASDLTSTSSVSEHQMNYSEFNISRYQWTPASKWWEVQVPYAHLGWDGNANRPAQDVSTPSILRYDLTEAFTQAQQSGAGIGSAIEEKRPVGVRLNRIWVNFGLWGNTAMIGGAAYSRWKSTPALRWAGADPSTTVQAITFNLKVELPSTHKQPSIKSGAGLLPFGGRAPTMSSVVVRDVVGQGDKNVSALQATTFNVPLYLNREAGEISPNITDRFRSRGAFYTSGGDWVVGDSEFGLGIGSDNDSSTFFDITYDPAGQDKFVSNGSTVAVWSTIDSYAWSDGVNGTDKHGLVQCSLSPRDSLVAVNPFVGSKGLTPSFSWDEFEHNNQTTLERSIHLNALTGLTVTHIASYKRPPSLMSSDDHSLCPHSFTVALTPIGDTFEVDKKLDYGTDNFAIPEDYIETQNTLKPDDSRRFKVGNWLDALIKEHNLDISGSMLPSGAKVWLEITVPQTVRTYGFVSSEDCTANGTWVGQVLCSFEVETGDGTALTKDVNLLSDE